MAASMDSLRQPLIEAESARGGEEAGAARSGAGAAAAGDPWQRTVEDAGRGQPWLDLVTAPLRASTLQQVKDLFDGGHYRTFCVDGTSPDDLFRACIQLRKAIAAAAAFEDPMQGTVEGAGRGQPWIASVAASLRGFTLHHAKLLMDADYDHLVFVDGISDSERESARLALRAAIHDACAVRDARAARRAAEQRREERRAASECAGRSRHDMPGAVAPLTTIVAVSRSCRRRRWQPPRRLRQRGLPLTRSRRCFGQSFRAAPRRRRPRLRQPCTAEGLAYRAVGPHGR
mmetsp:Transcript_15819/g.55012  ORF Transcript_15819/g.55012 Transcript_15819/m.55012 type:complete len:288 (-) Transcript_15819:583-1446(-)